MFSLTPCSARAAADVALLAGRSNFPAKAVMDPDDLQEQESDADLDAVQRLVLEVRQLRLELTRTLFALRRHRRTPAQIRAIQARANALLQRSLLMRQRFAEPQRIH